MRLLYITDDVRNAVKDIVGYASQPENLYNLDATSARMLPGDNWRHCLHLETGYRIVFSLTKSKGKVYRHISMSVPSKDLPNPVAVWTIAELFGFTGWDGKSFEPPQGWQVNLNEFEHCVAVIQEL